MLLLSWHHHRNFSAYWQHVKLFEHPWMLQKIRISTSMIMCICKFAVNFSEFKNKFKQERPPAWPLEVYRPHRTVHAVLVGRGYPLLVLSTRCHTGGGYPLSGPRSGGLPLGPWYRPPPPPVNKQNENITFPHTLCVGGNNVISVGTLWALSVQHTEASKRILWDLVRFVNSCPE